jgi:hypothetical protein
VLVNGVKLRAVFDSGAQTSVMTLAAAKRAGVTQTSPGVVAIGTGSGLGSKQVATWLAPFDKIALGGEVVPHPKFSIADLTIDADMLIGSDFIRGLSSNRAENLHNIGPSIVDRTFGSQRAFVLTWRERARLPTSVQRQGMPRVDGIVTTATC